MFIRPIFICAAGVIALQLLAVRAATVSPAEPPKGWALSDGFGTHYRLGYEPAEKAYFIENTGPVAPAGKAVNAETAPYAGGQRVPYSAAGLQATDAWAASMLQSVKAAGFRKHKVHFEADIKAPGFKGQLYLMLRGAFPNSNTTTTSDAAGPAWHTIVAEIDEVPDYEQKVPDDSSVTFGFLLQGEGRVMIRNVKLETLDYTPEAPHHGTYLQDMFGDPPAAAQPVNVEMRP